MLSKASRRPENFPFKEQVGALEAEIAILGRGEKDEAQPRLKAVKDEYARERKAIGAAIKSRKKQVQKALKELEKLQEERNKDDRLANVQQVTIGPLRRAMIEPDTHIYTDEYDSYNRLTDWGYAHRTVCHSHGEYARDEDGDGFHEVHVNTIEGFWSLLRSWRRPHRGISQEKLPLYLGFFESCTTRGFAAKGFSSPSWDFC